MVISREELYRHCLIDVVKFISWLLSKGLTRNFLKCCPCLLERQSMHFIGCALGFTQGQCVVLLAVIFRASIPILVSVKRYWFWALISFKMSMLRVYTSTFFPCTQMVLSFKQTNIGTVTRFLCLFDQESGQLYPLILIFSPVLRRWLLSVLQLSCHPQPV